MYISGYILDGKNMEDTAWYGILREVLVFTIQILKYDAISILNIYCTFAHYPIGYDL